MTVPDAPRRLGLSVLVAGGGSAQIVATGELDIATAPLPGQVAVIPPAQPLAA